MFARITYLYLLGELRQQNSATEEYTEYYSRSKGGQDFFSSSLSSRVSFTLEHVKCEFLASAYSQLSMTMHAREGCPGDQTKPLTSSEQ